METTESDGLPGLSGIGDAADVEAMPGLEGARGEVTLLVRLSLGW